MFFSVIFLAWEAQRILHELGPRVAHSVLLLVRPTPLRKLALSDREVDMRGLGDDRLGLTDFSVAFDALLVPAAAFI